MIKTQTNKHTGWKHYHLANAGDKRQITKPRDWRLEFAKGSEMRQQYECFIFFQIKNDASYVVLRHALYVQELHIMHMNLSSLCSTSQDIWKKIALWCIGFCFITSKYTHIILPHSVLDWPSNTTNSFHEIFVEQKCRHYEINLSVHLNMLVIGKYITIISRDKNEAGGRSPPNYKYITRIAIHSFTKYHVWGVIRKQRLHEPKWLIGYVITLHKRLEY